MQAAKTSGTSRRPPSGPLPRRCFLSDDDDRTTFAVLRMRLTDADARRFARRLEKLERDFMAANDPQGEPYALVATLFRRAPDA